MGGGMWMNTILVPDPDPGWMLNKEQNMQC